MKRISDVGKMTVITMAAIAIFAIIGAAADQGCRNHRDHVSCGVALFLGYGR